MMWRQGDILIERVRSVPKAAKPQSPDGDRLVLAYGEATGHAHALYGRATMFRDDGSLPGGTTFLKLAEICELRHEEHGTIRLKPGSCRVTRQREWTDDDEPRQVRD